MAQESYDDDLWEEIDEEQDDAVIGRAFRVSIAVFAVIAAVMTGIVWWLTRAEEAPPAQVVERRAPEPVLAEVDPPAVRFTDVTEAAGIDFVHENGAAGDKLLPETMGSGAAFLDHDGDGDQDLLFVNSTLWPEQAPEGGDVPTQALYANDGSGRFDDVTAASGLAVSFYGMGIAVGDVEGDGDRDLYFTALGSNHLFRNEGGVFHEEDAGAAGERDAWSTCAAFFDADRDGDLDLYVGNYVRWSREIDFEVDYRLTGIGRAYGPPTNFAGAHGSLYRNEGSGRFRDVSSEAGFHVENPATHEPMGKALGVRPIDVDGDGLLDVMVANDTVQNFLFQNLGDCRFEEVGGLMGVAFDRDGKATGAMGIDGAWYRGSDDLGFAIGNFANEMTSLYVMQGRRTLFADEAIGEGVGAPSRRRLSFGLFFFDYDLDGRVDLLQANGHLEEEINQVQASQHYEQPAQLFWNAGGAIRATFVEVDGDRAGDLGRPIVGRGASYADVDADGDLDVLLTQVGGRPMLLRNDQDLGHHWIRISLAGRGENVDALGAIVALEREGEVQRRDVMPTRSYLSQVELPVTFGLAGSADPVRVRVQWPDGSEQVFEDLAVDRHHVLEQRP